MSLSSALNIGRLGLTAAQTGVQVTGDNIANAATPGYTRRVVSLAPVGSSDGPGVYRGRGVEVTDVRRQIDLALESRLNDAVSRHSAALIDEGVLSQIESLVNELNSEGLQSNLDQFFNAFSELANNPSSSEARALIVEQGQTLASGIRSLRSELLNIRSQIDDQIGTATKRADELLREIAGINREISASEQGQTENAALRDRRDALVSELSDLLDVTANQQESGAVDIFLDSTPLVIGNQARGLETRSRTVGGEQTIEVIVSANKEKISPGNGRLGALLDQRTGPVQDVLDGLDRVTSHLINSVNRAHSSGRPFPGLTNTTGEFGVAAPDQALAFNDPNNSTFADLPIQPQNGSFAILVTDQATGAVTRREIEIDLDGVDNTGAPGFADDTSLSSLVADLNGGANINASVTAAGELQISAAAGFEFGFADDTSGALAALGVNTYFSGQDASDISVRAELQSNPELVVSGETEGSNEAALAIAGLRNEPLDGLGSVSILESWRQTTESIAVAGAGAKTAADASAQVKQSLEAQRAGVSGVSVDEESVNLLNFQRQYQASARFISTIDEMTQILLSLV